MKKTTRWVGLDVHAETIAVAVAEEKGEARSLGVIPNKLESVRKLVKKLGPVGEVKACYEAGPTGYALYWQLTQLGVSCEVIAPTRVPKMAGDRVKTDRRDAEKLAPLGSSPPVTTSSATATMVPVAPISPGMESFPEAVRACSS